MLKLNEDQQTQIGAMRAQLVALYPEQKAIIDKMETEALLIFMENSTLPALLGSFDSVRTSIINLLILLSNLLERDKYQGYIEALDHIPTFIDSYKDPYLADCGYYQTIGNEGNAEIKGCTFDIAKNIPCDRCACPRPNEDRPDIYKMEICPVCGGKSTKPCQLCFNFGKVEIGKICPECKGVEIECHTCSNTRINPIWED